MLNSTLTLTANTFQNNHAAEFGGALVVLYSKLQKKHFAIKCKNKSCRDALPPKNTSPKNQ